MRKLLPILITSLFFNSLSVFSQSYTAIDGTEFIVGDSILIGLPSYESLLGKKLYRYRYIKSYDANSKRYQSVVKKIHYKYFPIKEIKDVSERFIRDFDKNAKLIEFGELGFLKTNYYVDINNAIRHGEIMLSFNPAYNKSKILTDTLAFIFYANISDRPIENFAKDYLIRFKKELYKNTHEDEFEYQKSLKITKEEMLNIYSNFDFSQEFSIFTKLNVENYDFDRNGFPIKIEDLSVRAVKYSIDTEENLVDINFSNFDKLNFINIESEKANSFVKRRKDNSGNIDRTVYLRINFNLVKEIEGKESKEETIYSEINSVEYYDFEHCKYNWLGTSLK